MTCRPIIQLKNSTGQTLVSKLSGLPVQPFPFACEPRWVQSNPVYTPGLATVLHKCSLFLPQSDDQVSLNTVKYVNITLDGTNRQIWFDRVRVLFRPMDQLKPYPPPPPPSPPLWPKAGAAFGVEIGNLSEEASNIVLIAIVSAAGAFICCCLFILKRYGKRIFRRKPASSKQIAKLEKMVDQASTDPNSSSAEELSLLKEAVNRLVAEGRKGERLTDVVEQMLAARATLSPDLTVALQAEYLRRNPGSPGASEHELVELLKLMLEPPSDSAQHSSGGELVGEESLPSGYEGYGGVRLRPPKLFPVRESALPEPVVSVAFAEFEKRHGFAASSEQEAMLALRSAIAPHAKKLQLKQLNVPRPRQLGAKLPEQIYKAAASFTSGISSNPFQAREQMNLLKRGLDACLSDNPATARNGMQHLPPAVLVEARSLFAEQNGGPPANDKEALNLLKSVMDKQSGGPSYLSHAAQREEQLGRKGLGKLPPLEAAAAAPLPDELLHAAACLADEAAAPGDGEPAASAIFEEAKVESTWDGGGGVRAAPPKLHAPQEELLALQELIDKTLDEPTEKQQETIPAEPLDTTKPARGWDSGGGVRIMPPKLTSPDALQPAELPTQLQVALRDDFAQKAGLEASRGLEVDDLATRVVKGYDTEKTTRDTLLANDKAARAKAVVAEQEGAKARFGGMFGGRKKKTETRNLVEGVPLLEGQASLSKFDQSVLNAAHALEQEPELFGSLLSPEMALKNRVKQASVASKLGMKSNKVAPEAEALLPR